MKGTPRPLPFDGVKAPRVFRFLWIGKAGPRVRIFHDALTFGAYVCEVRKICGFDTVEFRTPILAIGVLK